MQKEISLTKLINLTQVGVFTMKFRVMWVILCVSFFGVDIFCFIREKVLLINNRFGKFVAFQQVEVNGFVTGIYIKVYIDW